MKRPKTFWSARDELHNLRFSWNIQKRGFNNSKSNFDTIQILLSTYIW